LSSLGSESTGEERTTEWNGDPAFQDQCAHLIDDHSPFNDEASPDAMEGLQLEWLVGLQRDTSHVGAAARFGDRLGVIEIVLVRLQGSRLLWTHRPPSGKA
jgi:hypothetical protein